MNPINRIQSIIEEDLRLRAGEFGIWSRLDDEVNDDTHLVIRRPKEGNLGHNSSVPFQPQYPLTLLDT